MQLLHFSSKPVKQAYATKQINNFPFKPDGFWYSCGDDWEEWAKAESYDIPKDYIYRIEVDYSKILTIRNEKQMKEFVKSFGVQTGSQSSIFYTFPD